VAFLIKVLLHIIEHHLLGPVQAHGCDNVRTPSPKTTEKPSPRRHCFYTAFF
jgi:hypothetical protein